MRPMLAEPESSISPGRDTKVLFRLCFLERRNLEPHSGQHVSSDRFSINLGDSSATEVQNANGITLSNHPGFYQNSATSVAL